MVKYRRSTRLQDKRRKRVIEQSITVVNIEDDTDFQKPMTKSILRYKRLQITGTPRSSLAANGKDNKEAPSPVSDDEETDELEYSSSSDEEEATI